MLPHQFFKMLADETRLRCLLLIVRQGSLCVCELTTALAVSQPKISRHLAHLRSAGVLLDQRHGQWVYYRQADNLPGWMNKVIRGLAESNCLRETYQADITRLAQMPERPCLPTQSPDSTTP